MGLFDFLKNKTRSTSTQENRLETALRHAATHVAYRADFYKYLLTDKLIVLTANSNLPEGSQTLKEDTNINIVSLQDGKIPVFTSTDKILENGIIKEKVSYIEIIGEDLFKFTTGATFILNPYSDFGKELLPNEIERLMNGTILTSDKKIINEKDTEVQIGQPARYPTEIAEALHDLFKYRPAVNKAYLAWIFNPTSEDPPHYIFAIDLDGDNENILDEAGFTAKQFLPPDEFIDFIRIDKENPLSAYFLNQTKPFYERYSSANAF